MVLIVFVIMLLNIRTETGRKTTHAVLAGSIVGLLILFQTCYFLTKGSMTGLKGAMDTALIEKVGHVELIGKALYTDFLLPFEITSLLLLVAIIGAVILSKRKI